MQTFKAKPKKWGNSLGVVIPKEIVEQRKLNPEKIITVSIMEEPNVDWKKLFGSLKNANKKRTKEILNEMDKMEFEHEEKLFRRHVRAH